GSAILQHLSSIEVNVRAQPTRRKESPTDSLLRERRELDTMLMRPGERPDRAVRIDRLTFIHKSILCGTAVGAASFGWFPLLNTLDVAYGAEAFKFAWISDNHLYPKDVNTRFVEKAVRAVEEVQAMTPPADFLVHGGDIAQL